MKVKHNIFLVGLSGSGKTTVGKILAKKLKNKFVDIDRAIELKAGKSISRIFSENGEKYFRKLESCAIRAQSLKSTGSSVIALGGGALLNPATRKIVKTSGTTVWLKCSIAELTERMLKKTDRPLLHPNSSSRTLTKTQIRKRLSTMYQKRKRHFEKADITINSSNLKPSQIAEKLARIISKVHVTI